MGAKYARVGKAKESFCDDSRCKPLYHVRFSGEGHVPRLGIRSTRVWWQVHATSAVNESAAKLSQF